MRIQSTSSFVSSYSSSTLSFDELMLEEEREYYTEACVPRLQLSTKMIAAHFREFIQRSARNGISNDLFHEFKTSGQNSFASIGYETWHRKLG